jgi:hypothetical protein
MSLMNSIKQVTSGLTSSLFLSVGFTHLAEKLDPLRSRVPGMTADRRASEPCSGCISPCFFSVKGTG